MNTGDSNLYPNLSGRGYSQNNFSANNLQYYNQNYAESNEHSTTIDEEETCYGQPQQPQQAYQHHQQQGPPGASVLDGLGMGVMGDAAFGPLGKHALSTGKQLMNDNFGRFMTLTPLKYYFNVNNSYVMNKVRLLMCPFMHQTWKRRIMRIGEVDSYAFPREDINAPDLYIPTMAFVTYVLLVGFVYGTVSQFTPELLGITASKALAALVFEIIIVKTMFYLFNCGTVSVLDLASYCGYKFVGLVASIVIGFVLSGYLYFIVSIYFGVTMGFFLIRTLRLVLVLEYTRVGDSPVNSSAKNYFLLVVAFFQLLAVYFLGVTV